MTVKYNGYQFNGYSHVTISANMQYDDADRTVSYHRYKLHVDSTIYAEAGDANVGVTFRRIRQLLSKAGQSLIIEGEGFGDLFVNYLSGGASDVAFGPKPRILNWAPTGASNAVELTWECEFCIPTCEGLGGVRFTGVSAFNYSVSFRIDSLGYTTRTVSGYLEIAMTRNGYSIPDTADAYRDMVKVEKPYNFTRETTWSVSTDKRRAEFTIVDTEIQTPNAYPPGVVKIRANHHVGWSRRDMARLPQVIRAQIIVSPNRPRGYAWEVFRSICAARIGVGLLAGKVFLEGLEVDEELYDNSITFVLAYRTYFPESDALTNFFDGSGLFTPLVAGNWAANAQDRLALESHRGRAGLSLSASQDQIIDLCTDTIMPEVPPPSFNPSHPPTTYMRFCNARPTANHSWLRFEAALQSVENNPSVEQITVGQDDLQSGDFNASDPLGTNGATDASANVQRYIESCPASMTFEWSGYAERVGYDIPTPRRLKFGSVTLIRRGPGVFRKRFKGIHFCQPLYAGAWKMRYVVERRPVLIPVGESDPVNSQGAPTNP